MIQIEETRPETPADIAERREAALPDGSWPVLRPDMTAANPIVARMSADCLAVFDEQGMIDEASLVRLGWRRETVQRFADKAREAFIRLLAARTRAAKAAAVAA